MEALHVFSYHLLATDDDSNVRESAFPLARLKPEGLEKKKCGDLDPYCASSVEMKYLSSVITFCCGSGARGVHRNE